MQNKAWCFLLIVALVLAMVLFIILSGISNKVVLRWPSLHIFRRKDNNTKKLILFYNRPSDWHYKFDPCEYNNCKFTDDKKDFSISDVILFHAPVVYRRLNQLPRKSNGQIWIYMSQEPPSEVFTSFKEWRNVFNWTWTNRRDSDIFDPYGQIEINKKPVNINYTAIYSKKTKSVFWFSSHCKTQAKREEYVKQLKKFMDVDIFGKCANLTTKKREPRDKYEVGKVYKFYLSFENSLCKDYVTEKILHMLRHDIVPIVRGDPHIEQFIPPGSYIDTNHFNSPKDLAMYLKKLETNQSEYMEYYSWKEKYRAFQIANRGICSMCELLTKADEHRSLYDDIDAWVNKPNGRPLCNENPTDIK